MMARQVSFTTIDSQPTKQSFRKWTFDKDVILASRMVDLHNIKNYNADTGFKTGYLIELERMMARKIPNCNIKRKSLIESRIKTLKRDQSTIFDIIQRGGNSGFGWDSTLNMVTVENVVWESYLIISVLKYTLFYYYYQYSFMLLRIIYLRLLLFLQSHKNAEQFRTRRFAFYEQLCQIYAKERASGRDAQTAVDILEEIAE